MLCSRCVVVLLYFHHARSTHSEQRGSQACRHTVWSVNDGTAGDLLKTSRGRFPTNRPQNELEYFTENSPRFCRKEAPSGFRWVSDRCPVGLRQYIIDRPHGVSTTTYLYVRRQGPKNRCLLLLQGDPACSNVFRFICGIKFLRNSKIAGLSCLIILF